MSETWKAIVGYEGLYEVSSFGRVKSLARIVVGRRGVLPERILAPSTKSNGYLNCNLYRDNSFKSKLVHRLVLEAFVGPCPPGQEARHLDGVPGNNKTDNLVWATHQENIRDKIEHGTVVLGEQHTQSKLTAEQVIAVREAKGSSRQIAKRFGISYATVQKIKKLQVWRHV